MTIRHMQQHATIRPVVALLSAGLLSACAGVLPFTRIDGSDRAIEAKMNGSWTALHADGTTLEGMDPPATLVFDVARRTLYGFDGCNNFRGSYGFDSGRLKAKVAATRRACTSDATRLLSARIHDLLTQGAEVVDTTFMGADMLMLRNAAGEVRMGSTAALNTR